MIWNEFYIALADFAEENGFNVVYYNPGSDPDQIYLNIAIGEDRSLLRFFFDNYKSFSYMKQFRYVRLYKHQGKYDYTENDLEYWKKWLLDKREEFKNYKLEEKMKRLNKDFGRTRKNEKSN